MLSQGFGFTTGKTENRRLLETVLHGRLAGWRKTAGSLMTRNAPFEEGLRSPSIGASIAKCTS